MYSSNALLNELYSPLNPYVELLHTLKSDNFHFALYCQEDIQAYFSSQKTAGFNPLHYYGAVSSGLRSTNKHLSPLNKRNVICIFFHYFLS